MPEVFSQMAQVFSGASTIFRTIKDGANAIKEAKNLELYERMLSVYGDVMELVENNRQLVEENRMLKEHLTIKNNLAFEDEHYWLKRDGQKEGPFCNVCWDIDSKLVRMRTVVLMGIRNEGSYACDYCARHRQSRK